MPGPINVEGFNFDTGDESISLGFDEDEDDTELFALPTAAKLSSVGSAHSGPPNPTASTGFAGGLLKSICKAAHCLARNPCQDLHVSLRGKTAPQNQVLHQTISASFP